MAGCVFGSITSPSHVVMLPSSCVPCLRAYVTCYTPVCPYAHVCTCTHFFSSVAQCSGLGLAVGESVSSVVSSMPALIVLGLVGLVRKALKYGEKKR